MLFFMVRAAAVIHAEPSGLADAALLEKSGEKTRALEIYTSLASDPKAGPESIRGFEGILRLENDVDSLVRAAGLLEKKAAAMRLPAGVAEKFARIAELAGRLEISAALYRIEYAVSKSASALDSLTALCIETNDLDGASLLIKDLGGSVRGPFLQAASDLQAGNADSALKALDRPAAADSSEAALRGLYMRYCAALGAGDLEAIERAARQLDASFPKSPEAAIAMAAVEKSGAPVRISVSAAPGQFMGKDGNTAPDPAPSEPPEAQAAAPQKDPAPAAPVAAPAVPSTPAVSTVSPPTAARTDLSTSAPKNASVQAGSYLVRENADDMVRVLREKGFPAVVREYTLSGKTYYRALAVYQTDAEHARRIVEELKVKGFDGLLIIEQTGAQPAGG